MNEFIKTFEKKLDKWFLGRRKGKAEDYLYCWRGTIPHIRIKELKKMIRLVLEDLK